MEEEEVWLGVWVWAGAWVGIGGPGRLAIWWFGVAQEKVRQRSSDVLGNCSSGLLATLYRRMDVDRTKPGWDRMYLTH